MNPIDWSPLDRAAARLTEAKATLDRLAEQTKRHAAVLEKVAQQIEGRKKVWRCRWF